LNFSLSLQHFLVQSAVPKHLANIHFAPLGAFSLVSLFIRAIMLSRVSWSNIVFHNLMQITFAGKVIIFFKIAVFQSQPLFSAKQAGIKLRGVFFICCCKLCCCARYADGLKPATRLNSPLNELKLSNPTA